MAQDAWNPKQYNKFKDERSQPFHDLMSLLQPCTQARIVDLGCGTGELTSELHHQLKAVKTMGIDSSDQMLEKARAFAAPGLSFEKGDIESWDLKEQFDIVFSNAALQWCSGHPQLFRKLREALRPSGQLAVQMPMNHDYPTHVLAKTMSYEEPWATLLNNEKYENKKTMLTPEEYAHILFRLGFKEQKVLLRVYGHKLNSREEVIEWVKGTLLTHFQSRLSEKHYSIFLSEFRKRLFGEIPDDRPFFYPFKRILIWARL